jgi:tetratricopeptide (TPR) repeat protein
MDELRLQKVGALRDAGRIDVALAELDAMIESATDLVERATLVFNKAALYSAQGSLKVSRSEMERALSIAPEHPLVRLLYDLQDASLYGLENNNSESFTRLTRTLNKHAKLLKASESKVFYQEIQHRRGLALYHLGRFQEAIPLLEESKVFDLPRQQLSDTLCILGYCYAKNKDHGQTAESLSQAIQLGLGENWEGIAHYGLGIAYAHLGRLAESRDEFLFCEKMIARLKAPATSLYSWLAKIYAALGQKAEAERYEQLSKQN